MKVIRREVEERAGFEAPPGVVVEEVAGAGENLDEGAAAVGVGRELLAGGEGEEGDASVVLAEERTADGALGRGRFDRERESRGGRGRARGKGDVGHAETIARGGGTGLDVGQGMRGLGAAGDLVDLGQGAEPAERA